MKWWPPIVLLCAFVLPVSAAPPEPALPDEATLKKIHDRVDKLEQTIASLRRQGLRDPMLAEIQVYHKAVDWAVRHKQFYNAKSTDWAMEALDRGLLRASQQASGEAPWVMQRGHAVVRAFRSRLDGSVQPYAITFPEDYGRDLSRRWRLDVVLHGRNDALTEIGFLHQFNGDQPAGKQDHVQLDVYGRGNNAYRWAGEVDVNEAIEAFLIVERMLRRDNLIDQSRIVLRGFSMGGAGTWHLGLHRPDRWCVLGPGAGFTSTKGYTPLPDPLPDHIERCLRIYDAADWAENVSNVPVVAYSGADDKQIAAARTIEERLKNTGLSITHLVAPGLKHEFPQEWRAKAEAEYAKHAAKGRPEYSKKVRFVTYTLKYSTCEWVDVMGLEDHYRKAVVEAEQTDDGYTFKTENVRTLHLGLPTASTRQELTIKGDGQTFKARPEVSTIGELHLYLEKRNGQWQARLPQRLQTDRLRQAQKTPGLQGPIDDAFMQPFLCVRGTGKPWHSAVQQHTDANLKRFVEEWDRWFRGKLLVKDDTDVTTEDIANFHLILFGDPGSNSLIAQVLDALPLEWTKESVTLGGARGASETHLPALIHPSPLNPERYVVLNSGHTFHAADFAASNAQLYPRLGDWALLKLAPTKDDPLAVDVVRAGLFDEFWQVRKR